MSFYIATIPFTEWIPDPMQRPIVYVNMIEWCKENIEPRHQSESLHYWFPRAFRGRTDVYKFHFRDEQDYTNFVQHFKLNDYI